VVNTVYDMEGEILNKMWPPTIGHRLENLQISVIKEKNQNILYLICSMINYNTILLVHSSLAFT
jgi:hypothetical protein